MLLELEKPIL